MRFLIANKLVTTNYFRVSFHDVRKETESIVLFSEEDVCGGDDSRGSERHQMETQSSLKACFQTCWWNRFCLVAKAY